MKERKAVQGKSTDQLAPHQPADRFECPHCHDVHEYTKNDLIPGEGRITK